MQMAKVEAAIEKILTWPLYVDESPDLSVTEARAKARRLHAKHPLGLIVIDYLQLMRTEGGENRNVEVGRITRGLKILAKELHVPVLAVSQLSRQVESRADKQPMLADLRDSGSVEQDADMVLFLYRDSYYHPDTSSPGEADLIFAKHRNGPTGKVKLTFLDLYPRFENYVDPDYFDAPPPPPVDDPIPF
jgi:replicative DNA helicase